jgi:hypothetical protein
MKAALDLLIVFLSIAILSGCAKRERPYTWVSETITHPDGTREEKRTIERNAIISASGYKLELDKFKVDERFEEGDSNGPGDSHYSVNSDGAKASPESQALKAFQEGLGLGAQFYGLRSQNSPELEERMAILENQISDLATIAEALRDQTPAPAE